MRITIASRAGLVGALLLAGLGVGVTPAAASNPAGVASLGSAAFGKAGQTPIAISSLADCAVEGPTANSSGAVSKTGITFGGGTTTCTTTVVDPANGVTTTKSEAKGQEFELSALVSSGGPRLKLRSYSVSCTATQSNTNATWSYGGATGLGTLPSPVPVGYVKPITKSDGTLLAEAIFNEQALPGDGSIGQTMLRIKFAPASNITGEVIVGRAACSPTP
ncbi:hypothetical protein [Amycolatopsis regifaucium]|uniref:Tat pathway signal sequence domain protein n=1 Tax=Amycolatopsis regifaucium TaxID=546365 RepID=A0A154MCD8_9PSEU|nr:hypothetical protein [Amycolatopsis regifaucium]KZB81943.1 hypothetical protein AVL48_08255 [Amycolatopsis regifaucium]OKA05986.1 hypothetical protein ATP06_0222740 [Amycolatopsis regifaucium]SFG77325.1 hypothetical protein SAMN04489731_101429 [Amycolatopsis regifaucium]